VNMIRHMLPVTSIRLVFDKFDVRARSLPSEAWNSSGFDLNTFLSSASVTSFGCPSCQTQAGPPIPGPDLCITDWDLLVLKR
jgi:hypothetical protein